MLLSLTPAVLLVVFIASGTASSEDVMKAVGDTVSFRPDKPLPASVSSIIWKQRKGTEVIKAIEWDIDDGPSTPNPRFKDITTLVKETGEITITGLKIEHSGVYTIDINSKEQEQRFTLTVKEQVPKPVITIEESSDPNVVYLRCEYSEPITWKNSAGETLTGNPISPKGESLTVKKNGDPENFYNCTLDNGASKKTSDPVYERDLFKDGSESGSVAGKIVGIFIGVALLIGGIIGGVYYYKRDTFKEHAGNLCPCLKGGAGEKQNNTSPESEGGAEEKLNNPDQENGGAGAKLNNPTENEGGAGAKLNNPTENEEGKLLNKEENQKKEDGSN